MPDGDGVTYTQSEMSVEPTAKVVEPMGHRVALTAAMVDT